MTVDNERIRREMSDAPHQLSELSSELHPIYCAPWRVCFVCGVRTYRCRRSDGHYEVLYELADGTPMLFTRTRCRTS